MSKRKRCKRSSGKTLSGPVAIAESSGRSCPPPPAFSLGKPMRNRPVVYSIIIAAIAMVTYLNTVDGDFVYDDIPIIKENLLIRELANIPTFFKMNYWGGNREFRDKKLYRPFTILTYALNYAVHNYWSPGYHLVNIVLHAIVCVTLYNLIFAFFGNSRLGLITSLIFAVHPIHTEAVANIIGRAEILALLGILLCIWCYAQACRRHADNQSKGFIVWQLLSLVGYFIALFSKEIGIIAPALIIALEILLPGRRYLLMLDRRAVSLFAGYLFLAVVFLVMRSRAVLDESLVTGFSQLPNHIRIFTALRICLEDLGLLVFPLHLSADYWIADIPIARVPWAPGVMMAIITLALMVAAMILAARRLPPLSWGIIFFFLALLPVSNLLFPIGVIKAERILYTPSAGLIVAASAVVVAIGKKGAAGRYMPLTIGLACFLFLGRTWVRNGDWHDHYTLATATLKLYPNNPEFNKILGFWYQNHGEFDRAKTCLSKSNHIKPNWNVLFNLGNIEKSEEHFQEAIDYYDQALLLAPNNVDVLNNKGLAESGRGDHNRAITLFEKLIKLYPGNPAAYANIMPEYIKSGETKKALWIADTALSRFPDNPVMNQNAGVVYRLLGLEKKLGESDR